MPTSRQMGKKDLLPVYGGIELSHKKKEGNVALWDAINGPGGQALSETRQMKTSTVRSHSDGEPKQLTQQAKSTEGAE